MDKLITQAKQDRDQTYLIYKSQNFIVDVLEIFSKGFTSPVQFSYPFPDDVKIFAIPAGQGIIDTRTEEAKQVGNINHFGIPVNYQEKIITIDIQPDPFTLVKSMNIDLLPTPIPIKLTFSTMVDGSGDLYNYEINEDLLQEDGIQIPRTMLDEIAKQMAQIITSDILIIEGDHEGLTGTYEFDWSVYLAVPS